MEKKRLIFYFYPMPSKFSKRPVNQVFPLFNGKRAIPSIAGLKQLLEYHGVELQKETLEQLWAYHQLLREHNKDQDLTRLNAFETIVERHYADCTLINAYVPEWPKRMIDVGSGAGFPGIPLKLVNPDIRLTLCEPRPNRIEFFTYPVQKVISRAFELIELTLPRIQKALVPGGRAYFMKGPAVKDELATLHPEDYGFKLVSKHFYRIPRSTQDRALVILEKEQE